MEPYIIVVLIGLVVSAAAYGLYQFSSVSYTADFAIPTVTASTSTITSTPVTDIATDNSATSTQTTTETLNISLQPETRIAPKIIFTEIMYDPSGADTGKEWLEIFSESAVNVSGWKLFENNRNHRIVLKKGTDEVKGYAVITTNTTRFLESYSSFSGSLFEASFSLNNTGEHLELRDVQLNPVAILDYSNSLGANGNNKSLEYRLTGWGESSVDEGTPGSKSSEAVTTTSTSSTISSTSYTTSSATSSTTSSTNSSTTSTSTQSSTSTMTETSSATSTSTTTQYLNHLLISEIMAGTEGNSNYEFIELFNPTSDTIDLTGWLIKKKASTGTVSLLVSSNRLQGKTIAPNKYFLAARNNSYDGSVTPDVLWPTYNIAYTNNSVILYNSNSVVEEVSWTEIPQGQSFERQSWGSNQFNIQPNPNPQNSNS